MIRPELFLISRDVIDSCQTMEVLHTYDGMVELGIAKLPYQTIDIGMNAGVYDGTNGRTLKITSPDNKNFIDTASHLYNCEIKFRYRDGECYSILIKPDCPTCKERGIKRDHEHQWIDLFEAVKNGAHRHEYDQAKYFAEAEKFKRVLVVLLATKNIVKVKTKDKLAALGIGKGKNSNHRPIYTTTLSLPQYVSNPSGKSPGLTLRPHLRRGHIRRQHHGPKMEFIKTIWIEPCFVNADEDFVSERSAYNTSLQHDEIMSSLQAPIPTKA